MSTNHMSVSRAARIAYGRLHQRIGWSGIAGAALTVLSLLVGCDAWWAVHQLPSDNAAFQAVMAQREDELANAKKVVAAPPRVLPSLAEISIVLDQTARGAQFIGLGWPAASYQVVPATDAAPGRLEVRCNFKGTYPRLRAFLDDYLATVPGSTVRELSMSRINSEVAEVDAKLVLAVLLKDEGLPAASLKPGISR